MENGTSPTRSVVLTGDHATPNPLLVGTAKWPAGYAFKLYDQGRYAEFEATAKPLFLQNTTHVDRIRLAALLGFVADDPIEAREFWRMAKTEWRQKLWNLENTVEVEARDYLEGLINDLDKQLAEDAKEAQDEAAEEWMAAQPQEDDDGIESEETDEEDDEEKPESVDVAADEGNRDATNDEVSATGQDRPGVVRGEQANEKHPAYGDLEPRSLTASHSLDPYYATTDMVGILAGNSRLEIGAQPTHYPDGTLIPRVSDHDAAQDGESEADQSAPGEGRRYEQWFGP